MAQTEIMPRYGKLAEGDIAYKIGDDPVTIADKSAEIALSNRFCDLLPGSKVVGEEDFASNQGVLSCFFDESPVWIIDPIDGTRAFVGGKPYFGVIVALAKHNQVLAGWLYDPSSDEFVTAEHGAGAYHKDRRLSVMPGGPLEGLTGSFGYHLRKRLKGRGALPPKNAPSHEEMGYACHDYARLVVDVPHFSRASPQIHFRASLSYCTPWDDSAGVLIHREAGGYSAHWDGELFQPSSYQRGLLLAPDKTCWEAIREWIGRSIDIEREGVSGAHGR